MDSTIRAFPLPSVLAAARHSTRTSSSTESSPLQFHQHMRFFYSMPHSDPELPHLLPGDVVIPRTLYRGLFIGGTVILSLAFLTYLGALLNMFISDPARYFYGLPGSVFMRWCMVALPFALGAVGLVCYGLHINQRIHWIDRSTQIALVGLHRYQFGGLWFFFLAVLSALAMAALWLVPQAPQVLGPDGSALVFYFLMGGILIGLVNGLLLTVSGTFARIRQIRELSRR